MRLSTWDRKDGLTQKSGAGHACSDLNTLFINDLRHGDSTRSAAIVPYVAVMATIACVGPPPVHLLPAVVRLGRNRGLLTGLRQRLAVRHRDLDMAQLGDQLL